MDSERTSRLPMRGFSLIELLVVIFIIGLMVATVSLSVNIGGDPAEQIEEQSQRLLEYARLAEDRAVLTGEPIGLVLIAPELEPGWRYQWQRYRGGQWLEAGAPLEAGQLPENLELSLEVEGELVDFGRVEQREEDEPLLPSVVFYPGGEVTPFQLTLFDAEAVEEQRVLTSERRGRVEIIDEEEALL